MLGNCCPPLAECVEFGDETHGGGILVPRWPQCLTVVRVGIAVHTLLLIVVNDGDAVGHKDEWHRVTKEWLFRNDEYNGKKRRHELKTLGVN